MLNLLWMLRIEKGVYLQTNKDLSTEIHELVPGIGLERSLLEVNSLAAFNLISQIIPKTDVRLQLAGLSLILYYEYVEGNVHITNCFIKSSLQIAVNQ